jgi:hypothetical protein
VAVRPSLPRQIGGIFVKTLKNLIRINWDDFALFGGVACGGFLVGEVLMIFIRHFDEDINLLFGGCMSLVLTAVCITFVGASHAMVTFSLALKCSRTRRQALGLVLGLIGAETLFALAVNALLCLLERTAGSALWAAFNGVVPDVFSPSWWVYLLSIPGGAVVGIISGAVLQRFGRKGFWGLWAVWMLGCFGSNRIVLLEDFIVQAVVVSVVVVIAALTWSVWSLLHATVRN